MKVWLVKNASDHHSLNFRWSEGHEVVPKVSPLRELSVLSPVSAVFYTLTGHGATRSSECGGNMKRKHLPGVPLNADPADMLRIIFQGKWRLSVLQVMIAGPVRLSSLTR